MKTNSHICSHRMFFLTPSVGWLVNLFISTLNIFYIKNHVIYLNLDKIIVLVGIDFCKPNPCNKGKCSNLEDVPGFKCQCDKGYTGSTCNTGKNKIKKVLICHV